jgi:hypothetical protein
MSELLAAYVQFKGRTVRYHDTETDVIARWRALTELRPLLERVPNLCRHYRAAPVKGAGAKCPVSVAR